MNKVGIIYWSGTGNTEQMAQFIAKGVKEADGTAALLTPSEVSASVIKDFDVIAFGCPSMGNEQLEESEFEPMFSEIEPTLSGKKIALFGSYGWGDGQWMRDWCSRCEALNTNLYDSDGFIINEAPDENGQEKCYALGRKLTAW